MDILIMLVVIGVFDLLMPHAFRGPAGSLKVFQSPEGIRSFHKAYGLVRFPRTLFALTGALLLGIDPLGPNMVLMLAIGGLGALVGWAVSVFVDVSRALRAANAAAAG